MDDKGLWQGPINHFFRLPEISEVYLHDISQEEVVEILWKKILDIISH